MLVARQWANIVCLGMLLYTVSSNKVVANNYGGVPSVVASDAAVGKRTADSLPDIVMKGIIVVEMATVNFIRELSDQERTITRRLASLCEREVAKLFHSVKGKQTAKMGSFRRGRRNKVLLVMDFDSTGNGNASEMNEIINRNIKIPGKFLYYDVGKRMTRFRSYGVCCQPKLHYAFGISGGRMVYDYSGFDNNGDKMGRIHVTRRGKCGKGARFRNSYVFLKNFRQNQTSETDSIAIMFWIKPLKSARNSSIFRGYYKGAVTEISLKSGFLEWYYITNKETVAFRLRHRSPVRPRYWTHVACIFDPYTRTAKMYINAELTSKSAVQKGLVDWRFTGWLHFGLKSSEGYLDDLYVYDCILGDDIIKSIKRTCLCEERCAPRGKNEYLVRMKLSPKTFSRSSMHRITKKVETTIRDLFKNIPGYQQVKTFGHRPVDVDKILVDYSLQSVGNSDARYLAGVLQPAVTAGRIGEVQLASNGLTFVPLSGKSVCRSSEMKCSDGECINKVWKCDGEINCSDGGDELNCGTPVEMDCDENEYQCNNSRILGISDCVSRNYRCDGQLDCEDDSDEKGCMSPRLVTAPRSLVTVAVGESATCVCAAIGVPTPIVSWYYRGSNVYPEEGKVNISSVAGRGTLTIRNLKKSDSGDYICSMSDNKIRKVVAPSCTIEVRAFGKVCVPPLFNSAARRSSQCLRCFCHSRTINCKSAKMYRYVLSSRWDCIECKDDEPSLVNENGEPLSPSAMKGLSTTKTYSYYWKLPKKYVGNKLTSYGGHLMFNRDSAFRRGRSPRRKRNAGKDQRPWNYVSETPHKGSWFEEPLDEDSMNNIPVIKIPSNEEILRAYDTPSQARSLNLTGYYEAILVGNEGTTLVSTKSRYLNKNLIEIKIHEDSWKEKGRGTYATRRMLLRVLTDIKYIFINAKDSRGSLARLTSVSLDTAIHEKNGNEEAVLVERCACPLGYEGLSCEKCTEGYFRFKRTGECMKCSCFNHSDTCNLWTAECEDCKHGTEGPNCQYCKRGSYGDAKAGTPNDCKPCKCPLGIETNQFSDSCFLHSDGKPTCSKCEIGYTGRRCERCAQGYEGNPLVVGGSCYKVGNFSQCHKAGSVSQNITARGEIKCTCKANVIGSLCGKCRTGTYNLQASNPSGCELCFCNRVSGICSSLTGTKSTINASFKEDYFLLTRLESSESIPHSKHESGGGTYLGKVFPDDNKLEQVFYWKLPVQFTGSKVASYGGFLEYTILYSWTETTSIPSAHDVVLLGRRFEIIYFGRKLRKTKYKNNKKQTFRVEFDERFWRFPRGGLASKHLFILLLAKIENIMILATPKTRMKETRLHNVRMDTVLEKKRSVGTVFSRIESCSCPDGYKGPSCETCAEGYALVDQRLLPRCAKCNCHGHSSRCDLTTGQCNNCQHNTFGKHCEMCKPGFYGDATSGSEAACSACPCPYTNLPNRFSFTCYMGDDGLPICDDCPEGHEGKRCERCKPSYIGNPLVRGDFCKPVTSCGCDVGGSLSDECDQKTKKCFCKKNVQGDKCTECKPGFYNLQGDNPDGCTKCFCMGFDTTCTTQNFYREQTTFMPSSSALLAGLSITTEDLSKKVSDFVVDRSKRRVRFLNAKWLRSPHIYWTLPRMFLGNQVMAYGGILKFSFSYTSSGNDISRRGSAVKIKGNGTTLHYKDIKYIPSNVEKEVDIVFLEKHWEKPDESAVSRFEFLTVLVHVEAILVRASFARGTSETSIGDIKMNVYPKEDHRQTNAPEVEICDCPSYYQGSSCESCVPGFTRMGKPSGQCVRCQCNSHARDCDEHTGVCQNCRHNTSGKNCELCARGFYGDATKKTAMDCKECACPLPGSTNRFSETCFLDKDGLPTCDACQEGYSGRRCEKCSLNYTGNPRTPGGRCFKVPVELIPIVKIIPGSITLQEQDSVRFLCVVKAVRPTQIIWSREDAKPLSSRTTATGNVLNITSVKKSDAGTYICTANNEIALRTAKAVLVVKEQQLSAVIVTVSPKSRYISVGGTARFACTSKTSSRYSIKWTRENDKPMPLSAHVQDGTLTVTEAQIGDGGTYICTGKNALNIDRAIVSLHVGVVVRPQVAVSPTIQIVDVAQAVKFRCSASAGFPAPILRWKRGDNKELPRFSKFFRGHGLFEILAVSRRDEGEYMCTASNSGGDSVMRVRLLVRGTIFRILVQFPNSQYQLFA